MIVDPPSDEWKLGTVVEVRKIRYGPIVCYLTVIGFKEDGVARLDCTETDPRLVN